MCFQQVFLLPFAVSISYRIVSYCDVVVVVFDRISHAINRIGNGNDFIEIFVFIAACLIYLKFEIDTRTVYGTDQAQCWSYWSHASFFVIPSKVDSGFCFSAFFQMEIYPKLWHWAPTANFDYSGKNSSRNINFKKYTRCAVRRTFSLFVHNLNNFGWKKKQPKKNE